MFLPSTFLVSLVLAALNSVPTCDAHPNHPEPRVRPRANGSEGPTNTTEYYEIRIRDMDPHKAVCVEAPTYTLRGTLRVRKGGPVRKRECTGADAQLWARADRRLVPKLDRGLSCRTN